jgi:hypothetical protein
MTEHQSSRTLVKSAPELWAECSDAASLARHLGAFGEIEITRLEPETTVAWEGAAVSGTVKLESSGWGTRVTLTVTEEAPPAWPAPAASVEPEPEPAPVEPEPEPAPVAAESPAEPVALEPEPQATTGPAPPRRGMFARLRLFRRKPTAAEAVVDAPSEPDPAAEPVVDASSEPEPAVKTSPAPQTRRLSGEQALVAALDSLGMAHHRPYSRA